MGTYLVVFKEDDYEKSDPLPNSQKLEHWVQDSQSKLKLLKQDLRQAELEKQIWAIGEPNAFNSVSIIATPQVCRFLKVHKNVAEVIEDKGNFELQSS